MISVALSIASFQASSEFCDDFDLTNDGIVEGGQVLSRNPIFEMCSAAGLLDLVAIQQAPRDPKAGNIAFAAPWHIPVASDLRGVGLAQNRVEDRLLRKPRRKGAHSGLSDQGQFPRAHRTPQG